MNISSKKSLGLYLVGAGIIAGGAAQGAIVYSSFETTLTDSNLFGFGDATTLSVISFDGTVINLQNTAGDGVSISADDVNANATPAKVEGTRTVAGGYSQTASILAAGDMVATGFATTPAPDIFTGDSTNNYIGVSTPTGQLGWVRFDVITNGSTVLLHDAAFESVAGQSIAAGAVPEASSAGVLALAGGLVALRRRRAA